MELRDVIHRRRMVRRYSDQPVDPVVIDRMLDHATRAPSAGFSQGWAFLRLDTPEMIEQYWTATTPEGTAGNAWLSAMRRAPVIIVALSSKDAYLRRYAETDKGWTDQDEARWPVPYWHTDAAMASLLILLTAVNEKLGACFFGIPPSTLDAFRTSFGIPESHAPIGAMTIGHRLDEPGPRGSPSRRARIPWQDVTHHGRWHVSP